MYKLIFELGEKCKLVFKPKRSTEIRKNFMNDTYGYPQKIEDNHVISLNISSVDTLKRFIPLALPSGSICGAFPINDNEVCYVYSGTLTDNPISASFGLRPFFVTNDTLIYHIPDEDFKKICQDVNMYIKKVIEDGSGSVSLMGEDLEILREILTTPIAANLDLYAKFFEIYCEKKCKAHISYVNSHKYCTAKVGLHPLLYIIESIPTEAWIKEHDRDFFIYLLQQDFLVDWMDMTDLDETRRRRILSEMRNIIQEIDRFNFEIIVTKIVKDLIDKRDIFTIIYFLSRYEGVSSTLKQIFDNLFFLLPKDAEKYLLYPKFQPQLFIDGFEIHFILMDTLRNIDRMKSDLKEIFDEVDSFSVGVYEPEQYIRYRFICKAKKGRKYIDYMDLPSILEDTFRAIITLARQNEITFIEKGSLMKESWLKRLSLKIVTPPQFETTTLEALSKRWILQRKVSEDIEKVYQFTLEDANEIYEKYFDPGTIPKELKIRLDISGLPLSQNACIEKKMGNVWRITDDKNHFIIIRRDVWVDIYVEIKAKIVSADVFCDYGCLVDQETKFNFFRDVQANYAYLNRLLEEKFDFKMVK
jgi:hypothetical protein